MSTRVVTGKARLNHVHLFEAFSNDPERDPSFQTMVMVPKSDKETMRKIREAEKEAAEEAKDRLFKGKTTGLSSIWKDGDESADDYPEQEGHWFAWVTKKGAGKDVAPPVLDVDGSRMLDPADIYSGCYGQVSMEAFAYARQGNKGVTFSLRAVKKLADGERLGPQDNPEDDFGDEDDLL